jgi:hypothetical protein
LFQPDFFKLLANEILKTRFNSHSCVVAASRTAISRYYYYIFLKCRERLNQIIKKDIKDNLFKKGINQHILIGETLSKIPKQKVTGNFFFRLRDLRNMSDYNLYSIVNENSVTNAKLLVLSLEKEIDNLKPSLELEQAFEQALQELQNRDISSLSPLTTSQQ